MNLVASIEGCIIKWTGRKGLKAIAKTYCDKEFNAADGVEQLPYANLCLNCRTAVAALAAPPPEPRRRRT